MNDEKMETRVAILERDVDELRQMRELIHRMDKKLDSMANHSPCPAPGMCLAIEPRVRVLEDERNKAIGGFKVLVFVGTAVGALGGTMGSWVLNKLTH